VRAFLHLDFSIFQMLVVTEVEMDKLIAQGGDGQFDWPFRFDCRKRVWPKPPDRCEVFFYDDLGNLIR
jgi:hypothetical protein